jgi:hypothetical protein
MATINRGRLDGLVHLLLVGLIVLAVVACGGASAPAQPATPTDTPADVTAESTDAPAPTDFIDTDGDGVNDIEGHVDDDGSDEPIEGPVDPGDGFEPSLYVDGDDRGRILGADPDPECSRSEAFRTETCTWMTGDGSASLSVEFSRDPHFSTLEAYVDHMETIMGSSTPIDDLGEAAYLGGDPLGSGVRLTAYLGDGLHIWVSINKEGDEAVLGDLALELAAKIVAMA